MLMRDLQNFFISFSYLLLTLVTSIFYFFSGEGWGPGCPFFCGLCGVFFLRSKYKECGGSGGGVRVSG